MKFSFALFTLLFCVNSFAKTLSDVKVQGLLQMQPARAFELIGFEAGETYDSSQVYDSISRLFASGSFSDIQVYEEDNVLTFSVVERASIGLLTIEGNELIPTEDLERGLKLSGLEVGDFYKPETLNQIQQELQRQYYSLGRYSAKVDFEIKTLPRNRVEVAINIDEGDTAKIVHINIIGNHIFDDEELTKNFDSRETGYFNPFSSADEYAKPKIQGDIEKLKSFYLDRGYLDFEVISSQVSLSADKRHVYIVINLVEGKPYTIESIDLNGKLTLPEEQILAQIHQEKGDVFSRKSATESVEDISVLFGNEGYLFARVNILPIKKDNNKLELIYQITPNNKVYVRRINFSGNSETRDEVLRREMTQFEGQLASHAKIQASKRRIERLGFFGLVTLDTVPVAGTTDLVDIDVTVDEQPSGSIQASIGYSEAGGTVLGLGVSKQNFLGTGNRLSFNVSSSEDVDNYRLSYDNPYFTVDGVSRGFDLFYKKTKRDDDENDSSQDFSLDTTGASVRFGYPISDTQRLSFGSTVKETLVQIGSDPSNEIADYISTNGDSFDDVLADITWTDRDLIGGILPTSGYSTRLSLNLSLPSLSDQTYGKINLNSQRYWNLAGSNLWLFRLKTRLGYGFSYSDSEELPFYEYYRAGGVGTVRGFDASSLGPLNSYPSTSSETPVAQGGNILITGTAELIFPMPFVENHKSVRTSLFLDAGNVFTDVCRADNPNCSEGVDSDEIRFSFGLNWTWVTPIAPLSFNLARALNAQEDDDLDNFQFQLGTTF
ncbi:outer membrane protein assembly factor BamA [Marinomonas agarivorans]|nr:outer membrane protein assembly factor BamA [Marinomonas agarivorans]